MKSKRIKLKGGREAIVDADLFDELSAYKWSLDSMGYPQRRLRIHEQNAGRPIKMHRHILKPPPGVFCDHKNLNKLDNRRANLRICTSSQNHQNARARTKRAKIHSRFKGVCWDKENNKWRVGLRLNYKTYDVGRFTDEVEAAKAYDEAARKVFGEFALTNFVNGRINDLCFARP